MLADKKSPNTRRAYAKDLRLFFRAYASDDPTPELIAEFLTLDRYRAVSLALNFRAKIHHRSGKPEVSPTILELIKIGIAHLESDLPDTADISDKSGADELRQQIKELDTRLREVESRLSGDQSDKLPDKDAPSDSSSQDAPEDAESTSDESSQGITKAALKPIFEEPDTEPDTEPDKQGLTDGELAEILGVNSSTLYRWRTKGTKPRPLKIARQLAEWEVRGDRWFKIKND